MRRAFTLVEILVSISIIALLLALLSPQLRAIRGKGDQVVSLSRISSHLGVMSVYLADQRDTYPQFADPRASVSYVYWQDQAISIRYFEQYALWNLGLGSGYVEDPSSIVFVASGQPRGLVTDYYYSCTFVATPEFWNPATRTGPQQWVSTRADQVSFTTAKGLLFCIHPYLDSNIVDAANPGAAVSNGVRSFAPTGFCDGSARAIKQSEFLTGYLTGEGGGPAWVGAVHLGEIAPTMHTKDGIRGRDVTK